MTQQKNRPEIFSSLERGDVLLLLLLLIFIPVLLYYYFLRWKTDAIYGDDLYMFREYHSINGFLNKVNMPVNSGKLRPVHGLSIQVLMETLQRNVHAYYVFNISVQALNTVLFALLLNLFLRAPFLSLLLALPVGIS